jgi:hypothetical protein
VQGIPLNQLMGSKAKKPKKAPPRFAAAYAEAKKAVAKRA